MKSHLYLAILLLFLAHSAHNAPVESQPEDLEEDHELIGGFFQGDMEIEMTRNGEIAESKRWPNGTVHYKIDEVFDNDRTLYILKAMKNIESVSCIRFIPVSDVKTPHLHFIGEPSGCHTKVGYRGKVQTLNLQLDRLDKGCFKLGTIMHEILHSLGFHHQQCATNRDDYVLVVEENIKDGKLGNFIKYDDKTVTDFDIEYDYGSILHYSSTAFSKNGEKTIIPLQGEDIEIGQRRALSASDINKLNMMYKCPILMI
ncbi:seminal metalloprotease 1-like [Calliphora vicina]|uniref:seminal metalloprotease 1-like n=1 Tax=Calliphora vicina TaxID=7373 RepID=UPI00325B73F2